MISMHKYIKFNFIKIREKLPESCIMKEEM